MLKRVTCAALLAAGTAAFAHGGGLDANGCHHDRRNGGYHCHRAPALSLTSPPAKANAPASTSQQLVPGAPTCYTGPRGGRYTITASGRKNYKGC